MLRPETHAKHVLNAIVVLRSIHPVLQSSKWSTSSIACLIGVTKPIADDVVSSMLSRNLITEHTERDARGPLRHRYSLPDDSPFLAQLPRLGDVLNMLSEDVRERD